MVVQELQSCKLQPHFGTTKSSRSFHPQQCRNLKTILGQKLASRIAMALCLVPKGPQLVIKALCLESEHPSYVQNQLLPGLHGSMLLWIYTYLFD